MIRCLFLAAALFSAPAWSAVATLNEAGLDAIYSQSSFGMRPIDIRYGSVIELIAPDLVRIDNETEFYSLVNTDLGLQATTLPVFFVDQISWCGGGATYAGCANTSGAVIDSDSAKLAQGAELIAHEIGHSLNLDHPGMTPDPTDDGADNLMQPKITTNTDMLVETQIDIIHLSDWVLSDVSGFYIDLAPVVVLASAAASLVPVPGALVLMLGALAPFGLRRRRG